MCCTTHRAREQRIDKYGPSTSLHATSEILKTSIQQAGLPWQFGFIIHFAVPNWAKNTHLASTPVLPHNVQGSSKFLSFFFWQFCFECSGSVRRVVWCAEPCSLVRRHKVGNKYCRLREALSQLPCVFSCLFVFSHASIPGRLMLRPRLCVSQQFQLRLLMEQSFFSLFAFFAWGSDTISANSTRKVIQGSGLAYTVKSPATSFSPNRASV